jgi:hypothetical protein
MIYKMRTIVLIIVLFVITTLTAIGQKPTVYYNVTKLVGSSDYYIGYRSKVTVTNSKKKGIDTTYYTSFQGLYAISDKEALTPLLKIDSKEYIYTIDNEQYVVVSSKSKEGVLHLETGKMIIPFICDNIFYIEKDDVFICQSKTEGNIHNRKGEKVNTVLYKKIAQCSSGYYDEEQSGTNAKIYNVKNELVVDFGAAEIIEEMYYENNYLLYKNGNYGIVNAKNEILLPFVYSNIELTESEIGEFFEASQVKNSIELKTIIQKDENETWKEILPLDFLYVTEIELYNSSDAPMTHPIKDAVYYGINSQNKGVFMDNLGKILLTLEDAPKLYQASVLEDKFVQANIEYSDYSLLYALENGKVILDVGYYYQGKLPAPFDNFLCFNKEGKSYGTSFVNSINYSTFFVSDYIYDFGLMKKDLQAIFTMGESTSHLLLFDIEKNIVRKSYSTKNYAEADYIWWEQYNFLVAQEDYSKKGSLMVYDLANDTMFYNGIQTPNAYKFALSSLASQMEKELKAIQPLTQGLVNLPHIITTKNSETTFSSSYYNDDINFTIIPFLSKKMEFEWLNFGNVFAIGSTISLSSNMTGRTYTKTTVLDDHLNVILPFQEGNVVNIIPHLQGSIVALIFEEDSINYYNTATQKTLYYNTIYTALKTKPNPYYFYDWMPNANHIIVYEKDFNYIIDYSGNVLYKTNQINYENVGNNYIIENADGYNKLTLLPSLVTSQVGEEIVQEYGVYPYVFIKNGQEYYGLYNAQSGKTVLNHEVKNFAPIAYNDLIWVENKDGKFALFNLKTNSIGKGYIFESEEAAKLAMYDE